LLFLFTEKSQLSAVSKQFVDLFSHALTYRSRHQSAAANTDDVETAEAAIISAFLLVTLRYPILQSSGSDFRILCLLLFVRNRIVQSACHCVELIEISAWLLAESNFNDCLFKDKLLLNL
jgi:hypothetical protein